MQNSHNLEESLRETACLGDVDKVGVLVHAGVDINSQNRVNGWTALHWAAKRNHKHIVSFLLQSGADPTLRSHQNELAANVTQSEEIRRLLSGKENKSVKHNSGADPLLEPCPDTAWHSNSQNPAPEEDAPGAGFVPNYLMNPEFPYSESATEFATRLGIQNTGNVKQNDGLASCNSSQAVNNKKSQFADNMQIATSGEVTCSTTPSTDEFALVVKCRLAESEETDFIEIELDQKCLNFEALVEICMTELNVDRARLKKVRKLPNTIIRNDRDVKRLVQYQEIEILID